LGPAKRPRSFQVLRAREAIVVLKTVCVLGNLRVLPKTKTRRERWPEKATAR
jgi:hypothetical protein